MRSSGPIWIALLIVGTGAWLLLRRDQAPPSEAAVRASQRDSIEATVRQRFRRDYLAVAAWPEESVPARGDVVLTLELQRRWIGQGQPIVHSARLLDVAEDSLGYVATFGPHLLSGFGTARAYFRVRVSSDLVARLEAGPRGDLLTQHIVVVEVSSVRRPALEIIAEPGYGDFPGAELEPGEADYLLVTGTLLDFQMVDLP